MGQVIQIRKTEEDETPHLSGEAVCIECGYECVQVCPVGVIWSECPKCHSMKMHMKYPVQRDNMEWECKCGNRLFKVTQDGYYCPNCGEWQTGF